MKFAASLRRAFGASALLVLVAGCVGSQTQTNALVPGQSGAATEQLARLGVGSTMADGAQTRDLLYVAKDGDVSAYAYPDGKLQGRLAGVRADGLCASKSGDVFVPSGSEVLHYAHGGTRPIAVLANAPGGAAQFCAVDPASGSLAVSGGTPASRVAVYEGAAGTPQIHPAKEGSQYASLAYDDAGTLYAATASGELLALAKGASRFERVAWNGARPARLDAIRWDGKNLAVAGSAGPDGPVTISRYTIVAGSATLAGRTVVPGAAGPAQLWFAGSSPAGIVRVARAASAVAFSRASQSAFAIATYHYDNLRTGWNDDETTLNYSNVNASKFGLLHTVALDDQVDTQPLVIPNVTTTRGAKSGSAHDVVYVTTESNSVYAIDASSGTVLFQTNLGPPVPTPLGCNNNGPNVGIDGTPVIDQAAGVMYVVAYTLENSYPTYRIHELSLSNLTDVVPSVIVSASHKLTNGATYTFNATYQRQRPGLLEANGNIYVGFGSFCDFNASQSRGWLLGWQAGTLAALGANRLNDALSASPDSFFLSSIWMSGYGVAADPTGNVYFVTGNSDYSGTTYNGVTNVQESVVKVSADLTQLLSIFTPSNQGMLDAYDEDFGSGGVMLLPQIGSRVPMAAAIGKVGTMYLLDQSSLGGYNPSGPNNDLAEVYAGGCWCGPSYYAVKNTHQRIVASGDASVTVWKVQPKSSSKLSLMGSVSLPSGQDPGFFTTITSTKNGKHAIVWALARPQSVPGPMTLFALKAEPAHGSSQLQTLWQETAGFWASSYGNANAVPVVANGKAYVATYQQLDIFGLGGSAAHLAGGHAIPPSAYAAVIKTPNEVTGKLVRVNGSFLTVQNRAGKLVRVDDALAVKHERTAVLVAGEAFDVRGTYDAAGVMHAAAIVRAKPSPSTWAPDR